MTVAHNAGIPSTLVSAASGIPGHPSPSEAAASEISGHGSASGAAAFGISGHPSTSMAVGAGLPAGPSASKAAATGVTEASVTSVSVAAEIQKTDAAPAAVAGQTAAKLQAFACREEQGESTTHSSMSPKTAPVTTNPSAADEHVFQVCLLLLCLELQGALSTCFPNLFSVYHIIIVYTVHHAPTEILSASRLLQSAVLPRT